MEKLVSVSDGAFVAALVNAAWAIANTSKLYMYDVQP